MINEHRTQSAANGRVPVSFISIAILIMTMGHFFAYGQDNNDFKTFNFNSLRHHLQSKNEGKLAFLSENTLKGRFLRVAKQGRLEYVSEADEVDYVIQGTGQLNACDTTVFLNGGTIFFVPRDSRVSLQGLRGKLLMVRLSSLENKSKRDTGIALFSMDKIKSVRSTGNNVWNAFLKRSSMTFGLYMLPRELGGDSVLTHRWDEVNIIVNGTAKFQVGTSVMDVKPGDIVYVKKGNGHFFHTLRDNLAILILFEKRSVQE